MHTAQETSTSGIGFYARRSYGTERSPRFDEFPCPVSMQALQGFSRPRRTSQVRRVAEFPMV